jgi:hypothetical protein
MQFPTGWVGLHISYQQSLEPEHLMMAFDGETITTVLELRFQDLEGTEDGNRTNLPR